MTEFNYGRYTSVYMIVTIVLIGVNFFLKLPIGLSTFIPCMAAAMYEGQKFAEKTGETLDKKNAWRFARAATGIVFLANLVFLGLLMLTEVGEALRDVPVIFFVFAFVVLMSVVFLTNRYFLGFGVKQGLKVAERARK